MSGGRPQRPLYADGSSISDEFWALIESCWAHQIDDRPTMSVVLNSSLFHSRLASLSTLPKMNSNPVVTPNPHGGDSHNGVSEPLDSIQIDSSLQPSPFGESAINEEFYPQGSPLTNDNDDQSDSPHCHAAVAQQQDLYADLGTRRNTIPQPNAVTPPALCMVRILIDK